MSERNELLRSARESMPSSAAPGEGMSRAELAEEVNAYLYRTTGKVYDLDRHQIARYERGAVRWPCAPYRSGFRAVLRVSSDVELGFRPSREPAWQPAACDTAGETGWNPAGVADLARVTTSHDLMSSSRGAVAPAPVPWSGPELTEPLQCWLRPLPASSRCRTKLAETEVAAWEEVTSRLRGWSSIAPASVGRKAAVAQLSEFSERLGDVGDGPLGRRAFLACAELAEVVAGMSWDSGLHRQAQRYYVLAVRFAKVAGEDEFAATVLAALARQCYDLGRPDDGLELIQLAQYGVRKTRSALLRSMLATREAWSYAQVGDRQRFDRAVGRAEQYFAEGAVEDERRWVAGFDEAELHGVLGGRFRDFAQHDPSRARRAQDYITTALSLRQKSKGRNRAFDLIGLARAHLISDEPDRACELIEGVLPLAVSWASGRVGAKLADFQRESARYAAIPMVGHCRDAIRDLIRC